MNTKLLKQKILAETLGFPDFFENQETPQRHSDESQNPLHDKEIAGRARNDEEQNATDGMNTSSLMCNGRMPLPPFNNDEQNARNNDRSEKMQEFKDLYDSNLKGDSITSQSHSDERQNPLHDKVHTWKMVKLGEVCEINPKNRINDNVEVSFIPMTFIQDGFKNTHISEIKKWKDVKKGFTHFQENDIGIAKITPCFENRKSVIFNNLKNGFGAGTTELHILRPKNEIVMTEFVFWLIKTENFLQNGIKKFTGTVGQQRVGKNIIADFEIPLPPLSVQRQIVERIECLFDEIDRIESSRQALLKLTKIARQKTLQETMELREFIDLKIERLKDLGDSSLMGDSITSQRHSDESQNPLHDKEIEGRARNDEEQNATDGMNTPSLMCNGRMPSPPFNNDEQNARNNDRSEKMQELKDLGDSSLMGDSITSQRHSDESQNPLHDKVHTWKMVKLGEVGHWQAGTTPSRTIKKFYENGDIPWLKTGDLNDGYITEAPEKISEIAMKEYKQLKLHPKGAVAIALYGATIGKCGIFGIETTTNQACLVCRTNELIYNKYLFYFLISKNNYFKEAASGGAQPNISKEIVVKTEIHLPPISVQRQIVEKIETVFGEIDKIERAIGI